MTESGHGGTRPGAGRPSAAEALYRDRLEDLVGLVGQADTDLARAVTSQRMVRACAISILRDPRDRRTWRQEKDASTAA